MVRRGFSFDEQQRQMVIIVKAILTYQLNLW